MFSDYCETGVSRETLIEEMAEELYKKFGYDYSYTTWKEAKDMIIEDYNELLKRG